MTTADQLAARAMALAAGACDDDLAVAELCRLAVGNDHALDQAILACLAQPASLTARRLAIELLARALYELLAAKPQFRRLQAGRTLVEEGRPGSELFLLFDGMLRVEVDGTPVAGRSRRSPRAARPTQTPKWINRSPLP